MSFEYLQPNLIEYNTLEELNNFSLRWSNTTKRNLIDFINSQFRSFIVGEPGTGKSEFLKQLKLKAEEDSDKKMYLLDLKVLKANDTIIDLIKKEYKLDYLTDTGDVIICLDALDEVPVSFFRTIVKEIFELFEKLKFASILVSCRRHYIDNNKELFANSTQNITYILVDDFSSSQIYDFLKKSNAGIGEEAIKAIVTKAQKNNGLSILRVPRYLNVISSLLRKGKLTNESIFSIKRADLFEAFIFEKIDSEISKNEENKVNENIITKRVLEKLALVMEIYQVNQISKDELMTFLDDVVSNSNVIFLNYINIDSFVTRLLKENARNDIEFDNTEFQEYLAAKELLRFGNKPQILFDLIIDHELLQIKKNWFEVLKFVVEIDSNQLISIFNFFSQKGNQLLSRDIYSLIEYVEITQLNEDNKTYLFDMLLERISMEYEIINPDALANSNGFSKQLNRNIEFISRFFQKNNNKNFRDFNSSSAKKLIQIRFIEHLINREDFQHREQWEIRLIKTITDAPENNLKEAALAAIAKVDKLNSLKKIDSLILSKIDPIILATYIKICVDIDPNDVFTIKVINVGIKQNLDEAKKSVSRINKSSGIIFFLDELISDSKLRESFCSSNFLILGEIISGYNFFLNLKKMLDNEIKVKLIKILTILINDGNRAYLYQDFIINVSDLIIKNDKSYLIEFLNQVKDNSTLLIISFQTIITNIEPNDVEEIINICRQSKHRNYIIQLIFGNMTVEKNKLMNEILGKFKTFYRDFNLEAKNSSNVSIDESMKFYQRFKSELNTGKNTFKLSAFTTFVSHYDSIIKYVSPQEKDELYKHAIDFLKTAKISKVSVEIKLEEESSRTITSNIQYWEYFVDFIKTLVLLNKKGELKLYRNQFISALLVVRGSNELEYILEHLDKIEDKDEKYLISILKKRNDHLFALYPKGIIELINRNKLSNQLLRIILHKMLTSPEVFIHEKIAVVHCLGGDNFVSKRSYFNWLFHNYKDKLEIEIVENINEVLIVKFNDAAAIQWRFDQLKRRKIELSPIIPKGARKIKPEEREMEHPVFFTPILGLNDESLFDKFIDILGESFKIRSIDGLIRYSNYLQTIVYSYFSGLKSKNSYSPILKLKKYFDSEKNKNKSSFKVSLQSLELEYLELNKITSIGEAIHCYNELKSKKFIPITSVNELFYTLELALDEVKNFVENEGFYKIIRDGKVSEDVIQKTLITQLENSLLKKGLRKTQLFREVNLLDDKRLDYTISHGFIGPIMIEIKLLHNSEIVNSKKRSLYKQKLEQYLKGSGSSQGIYLIFKVNDRAAINYFEKVKEEYSDLENLKIILVDCTMVNNK